MPFVSFVPWPTPKRCLDAEHNPPGHIVLQPGLHVWVCPACGARQIVRVAPRPTCSKQAHNEPYRATKSAVVCKKGRS